MAHLDDKTVPLPRVGFIGLGSQGGPIARRIIEAGVPTTLWARRPESLDPFADTPAQIASTLTDLAVGCDIVCVCVVDDDGVEAVVSGPDGLLGSMRAGTLVVIHSTVHPDLCVRLAQEAAGVGIDLIEAPVSGGGPAAERGDLLVMIGGATEAVERCRPVMEAYGDPIIHLGQVGAGQRAKLVNNVVLAANLGVVESAFGLARDLGVDLDQLSVLLKHGTGRSFATALIAGPRFDLAPVGPSAGALLQKDVRLVVDLAELAGSKATVVLDAADAALESMGHPR